MNPFNQNHNYFRYSNEIFFEIANKLDKHLIIKGFCAQLNKKENIHKPEVFFKFGSALFETKIGLQALVHVDNIQGDSVIRV